MTAQGNALGIAPQWKPSAVSAEQFRRDHASGKRHCRRRFWRPGGTSDNSPAFQRRVCARFRTRPGGTAGLRRAFWSGHALPVWKPAIRQTWKSALRGGGGGGWRALGLRSARRHALRWRREWSQRDHCHQICRSYGAGNLAEAGLLQRFRSYGAGTWLSASISFWYHPVAVKTYAVRTESSNHFLMLALDFAPSV